MTSKQRVRAAAARKPVDRVPAAFEAVDTVKNRLIEHYGFDDMEQIYEKFEIDTRYLSAPYIGPPLKCYTNDKGNLVRQSFWGFEEEEHRFDGEHYDIACFHPLNGVSSVAEVDSFAWPDPDWFDYEAMSRECDRYPDKAIVTGHEGPFQIATFLISMEEFFILLIENPEVANRILEKMVAFELEYYRRIFEACKGKVDILRPHDDYGTQLSLLFGLDMWREFFRENTCKLVNLAHRYGVFYQQHSCGAIAPLIPGLITCGVDILEPLQKLEGLEPETLRELYGDRLAFHGGVDTQMLLPNGTPEQVRAETSHYINILGARGGGYILMASQNFENDVPVANIEAIYSVPREP